jgi:hypothetical protein
MVDPSIERIRPAHSMYLRGGRRRARRRRLIVTGVLLVVHRGGRRRARRRLIPGLQTIHGNDRLRAGIWSLEERRRSVSAWSVGFTGYFLQLALIFISNSSFFFFLGEGFSELQPESRDSGGPITTSGPSIRLLEITLWDF